MRAVIRDRRTTAWPRSLRAANSEDEYAEAKQKCEDLEKKLNEYKKKAEEADEDKKKAEAKNMVEGFAKICSANLKWESVTEDNYEEIKAVF